MKTTKPVSFTNLDEMLRSSEFEMFQSSTLGNDLFINDPDRAERIHKYAEDGGDGSTHGEHIQDWRDFLGTLRVIDSEYPEDGGEITVDVLDTINDEIDKCEQWHIQHGGLDIVIG